MANGLANSFEHVSDCLTLWQVMPHGLNRMTWIGGRLDFVGYYERTLSPVPPSETRPEHFLEVLRRGTVATNIFLRRMQTFALEMDWLPAMILRRQWPTLEYQAKRAIKFDEHQRIVAIEKNPERKQFYQLCWHVGASQGDVAQLQGQNIDWPNKVLSFFRQKTGTPVMLHLGKEALALLEDMASEGPLFPGLVNLDAAKRARVFKRHRRRLPQSLGSYLNM